MAQARRKPSKSRPGHTGGSWSGIGMLLAGMVIGSLATLLWHGASTGSGGVGAGIRQMFKDSDSPQPAPPAGQVDAQPSRDKPATDFTFFTVLPEIEVVAPPADTGPAAATETGTESQPKPGPGTEPAAAARASRFMLQAGSFRNMPDADRLKANLALRGIVSSIQKVTIQGRG
ncbi:MAG: SPOR domain-containing protein, partial [Gammaproteobacteria bacterium]|nr:SPOR domain-containing protein [Gammaproteobacteria bacterium]